VKDTQEQKEHGLAPIEHPGLMRPSSRLIRRGLDALLQREGGLNAGDTKSDLIHKWQTEEQGLSADGVWTVLVHAHRYNGEEIMGWGWVPMHEADQPTATVTFHQEAAATLLRTLYSAFTALHDPDDYLKQAGFTWAVGSTAAPKIATVGGAQDYGSAHVVVDWSGESRYSVFTISPPDTAAIKVVLGIESVAHILQLTMEAFRSLDWPFPP
jgi:hypothetical protein